MVTAKLPDQRNIIVLVDSGASHSLVCSTTVNNSPYLSRLPRRKVKELRFRVGNGEYITTNAAIDVQIKMQGHKFVITALIMNTLGGINLVLGNKSLSEINASLDFQSHKLRFKCNSIPLKASGDYVIQPNQTRHIIIDGKVPSKLRHANMLAKSTKFLSKFTCTNMLIQLQSGRSTIIVHNGGNRPARISKNKPLATLDTKSITNFYCELAQVSADQEETTLHYFTCQGQEQDQYLKESANVENMKRSDLLKHKSEKFPFLEPNDDRLKMYDREIIERDIKFQNCVLDPEGRKRVKEMLFEHRKALSLHSEVGQTNITVDFQLSDQTPFYIRPFTVSPAEKPIIDKELDKLVKMGILQEGTTQYSSPVMLLKKKDSKTYRLVTDFRHLNQRILKRNLPFPLIRDAMQIIGHSEASVLSVLDLKEAYHCLNLSKQSSQYCGITSYFGGRSFLYKKLPMGLNISPCEFQAQINRILNEVQHGNEYCIGIMDDLIVYSKSIPDHFQHLRKILTALEKHGLKISPAKAKIFRNQVIYMGHEIVILEGQPCIRPLKERTEAIIKLPVPNTKRKLKGFIGKVSYLSMYLDKLQVLLKPLHAIASKKADFVWTQETQASFDEILKLLQKPPILAMPRAQGTYKLYCDTSRVGVGASLWQMQNGRERLIAYYSKALPKAASNYGITELELTGLEISVGAFKHLLKGVHFEVFTDHAAIPLIMKSKTEPATDRIKRLLEKLSNYSMTVGFRKGASLVIADYLSRNPPSPEDNDNDPIAFPAQFDRPVTRAYAKQHGIQVPSLYKSPEPTQSPSTNQVAPSPNVPVPVDTQTDIPVPSPRRSPVQPQPAQTQVLKPPSTDLEPRHRLVDTAKTKSQAPIEAQVLEENEDEVFETHTPPPSYLTRPLQSLLKPYNKEDVILRHIPKQKDLDQMLARIKSKVLQNYHLPFSRREMAKEQSSCPFFRDIYVYLKNGMLPSAKKAAKKIICESENYIMIDEILFRLNLSDNSDEIKVVLAVPDTLIAYIISLHHDSLLSCHQGVNRVALTIRRSYYFPRLHQRVYDYVKSCHTCQTRKTPKDTERPFEVVIPTQFAPFHTVYCDLKVMHESYMAHKYLLVLVCGITRYTILAPLVSKDAATVAEAILQKCVLTHGPFKRFISDEGREFNNQVINYIFNALKVDQRFCSVGNHKSNKSERFVGTVSQFLTSCLTGNGRNWHLFCNAVAYAINSFSMPGLGGFCPYYLVYLRQPSTAFDCSPVDQITSSYRDYVDLLKQRLEKVSKTVLDLQAKVQNKQAEEQMKKVKNPTNFVAGMLIYLLSPSHSALQTNTRKIRMDFVGPLAIKAMLDRNHATLQTLQGRQVHGIFHVNRLKIAWIRTRLGITNNLKDIKQDASGQTTEITNERGESPVSEPENYLSCMQKTQGPNIEACQKFAQENECMASPIQLEDKVKAFHAEKAMFLCKDTLEVDIDKARFKNGSLQLLTKIPQTESPTWIDMGLHPNTKDWTHSFINNARIKICGSQKRFTENFLAMI